MELKEFLQRGQTRGFANVDAGAKTSSHKTVFDPAIRQTFLPNTKEFSSFHKSTLRRFRGPILILATKCALACSRYSSGLKLLPLRRIDQYLRPMESSPSFWFNREN